jgi:hypothetical protein
MGRSTKLHGPRRTKSGFVGDFITEHAVLIAVGLHPYNVCYETIVIVVVFALQNMRKDLTPGGGGVFSEEAAVAAIAAAVVVAFVDHADSPLTERAQRVESRLANSKGFDTLFLP